MIYLKRSKEPLFWSDFKSKHLGITYEQLEGTKEGKEVRRRLRSYNIEQQHGLCAYCCKKIDLSNSLNEHIKPKGKPEYSNISMEYSNIVASCNDEGKNSTCSAAKGDSYEKIFISPLDDTCEYHFEYYPNGKVVSDSKEGKYTIELLNLNSYKLVQARKAQLKVCKSYQDSEMVKRYFLQPDSNNLLQPFADIVRFFYDK